MVASYLSDLQKAQVFAMPGYAGVLSQMIEMDSVKNRNETFSVDNLSKHIVSLFWTFFVVNVVKFLVVLLFSLFKLCLFEELEQL